jgi:hypothetical protein
MYIYLTIGDNLWFLRCALSTAGALLGPASGFPLEISCESVPFEETGIHVKKLALLNRGGPQIGEQFHLLIYSKPQARGPGLLFAKPGTSLGWERETVRMPVAD